MRKIYISGCISKDGTCTADQKELNKQQFYTVATMFETDGWKVVNPLKIPKPCEKPTWRQCLEADLKELFTCDYIYMLRGWEESKGARLELHVAMELGLKIYFA